MKFISWNVAGIRACYKKGFEEFFLKEDADIYALQEVKATEEEIPFHKEGYYEYLNNAEKKGYSGVMIYTKHKPINVTYGIGIIEHDQEGRVITLEYNDYYFVCCYTPNSKRELLRLDYRMKWEDDFRDYLINLDKIKPVILCGDLNVAHQEIDLKNPKTNQRNAGFTIEERTKFTELLNSGFTDTFRTLHKEEITYSWWSYLFHAREKNAGWRIDYFVVSNRFMPNVIDSTILTDIYGSDHCPVKLEIKP